MRDPLQTRDQVKLLDFGLAKTVRALPVETDGEAGTLSGALTADGALSGRSLHVGQIAANVSDEELRATFLSSAAVREIMEGAGESFSLAPNRGPPVGNSRGVPLPTTVVQELFPG
jgi:hypothetical protein